MIRNSKQERRKLQEIIDTGGGIRLVDSDYSYLISPRSNRMETIYTRLTKCYLEMKGKILTDIFLDTNLGSLPVPNVKKQVLELSGLVSVKK